MKHLLHIWLVTMLMIMIAQAGGENKYGKKITLKEKIKISVIIENPDKYLNKKVLVEGVVLDVCKNRGCWMELSSDRQFQKIKVKVDDGVIVFPVEAKGKTALVEGKVYKIEFTKEEAIERAKHHAEEQGLKFDPLSVKGPETIYQIKGIGAVIK